MCHTLKLPCFHTPSATSRIASVSKILATHADENVKVSNGALFMSGNRSQDTPSVEAPFCPKLCLPGVTQMSCQPHLQHSNELSATLGMSWGHSHMLLATLATLKKLSATRGMSWCWPHLQHSKEFLVTLGMCWDRSNELWTTLAMLKRIGGHTWNELGSLK